MLPTASSREVLRLVEGFGLSGSWVWTFDGGEHVWSPGLHRLLGLTLDVRPDFALLHELVHPEDRAQLPTPAEVAESGFTAERRLRILRSDGTLRTVESRSETYHSPAGRPLRAMGVLVDVSDREALLRARAAQSRRDRALFEQTGAFTSASATYPFRDFSDEWVDLVGLPKAELLAEPTRPVLKDERRHWRDHGRELYLAGKVVHTLPNLRLAGGEVVRYRMVMAPVLGPDGAVACWSNYVGPLHVAADLPRDMVGALERRLDGRHVRAARALLDWSMGDLAKASGLSISTIRRMEDGGDARRSTSMGVLVAALRRHGIRFSLMEDATIALGMGPRRTVRI